MDSGDKVKEDIKKDIEEIEILLEKNSDDSEKVKKLHMKIDSKYQSKINNWGHSFYGWMEKHGFAYSMIDSGSMEHNLLIMKGKLEGYLQTFNVSKQNFANPFIVYNTNNNQNTASNITEIKINFKDVEEQIKNMESLTDEETTEALQKLKELETINNSSESRKKKWETAKKILVWLADKSVEVGIAFIPIVMQVLS
ncbi:MAG: hypothetical protein PHN72_05230 [Bacilli bacterium]|nr:hypothetical protein [Bacilli bacterium]